MMEGAIKSRPWHHLPEAKLRSSPVRRRGAAGGRHEVRPEASGILDLLLLLEGQVAAEANQYIAAMWDKGG